MPIVRHDGDTAAVLALSDERDLHLRLRLAAWHEGYAAGQADLNEARLAAYADGWEQATEAAAERGRAA